jgi:hypothetical protein
LDFPVGRIVALSLWPVLSSLNASIIICTKFDLHSLLDPRLQMKRSKKSALPSNCMKFCVLIPKICWYYHIPLNHTITTAVQIAESSGSCLENWEYGRRDPSRWPRGTLFPQKLAITSPTSGGRLVGIVRSRTQTMEFSFSFSFLVCTDSSTTPGNYGYHYVMFTIVLLWRNTGKCCYMCVLI